MPKMLHKCIKCGRYTLNDERCPICGSKVVLAHPPRFSPTDRYGEYRRKLKKAIQNGGRD